MIEKIKTEIERLMNARDSRLVDGSYFDFKNLLSFIESLEKEQPQGLDEAAEEYAKLRKDAFETVFYAFKAGAKWRERQMEMPDSTKLLSEWKEVKSILKEKDLRNDEWRLAYHSFLFGFSRGLNTKKSNE